MDPALAEHLHELAEFGRANDASTQDRPRKMLNITHDTGVFLALLVKATASRNVLEIGTSNGYSTLWLADAVGDGGTVTTVEKAEYKIGLARANIERAGLASRVRQIDGDAGDVLASAGAGEFDLVFLDGDREQYAGWWEDLRRVLAPGDCSSSTTRCRTPRRWPSSARGSRTPTGTWCRCPRSGTASWWSSRRHGDLGRLCPADEFVDDHGGWTYTTVVLRAPSAPSVAVRGAESTELRWVRTDRLHELELHPGFARTWPRLRELGTGAAACR